MATKSKAKTNDFSELEAYGKFETVNIDQLVEATNVREDYDLAQIKPQLLIGGVVRNLVPLLVDEQYNLIDGFRRYFGAKELQAEGKPVAPFNVLVLPPEIANNPRKILEIQIKLGTSAKTLNPLETVKGQIEWIQGEYEERLEAAIAKKVDEFTKKFPGESQASILAKAKSEVAETRILSAAKKAACETYNLSDNTINKLWRFGTEIDPILRQAAYEGLVALFDAVDTQTAYNTLTKTHPDVTMAEFYAKILEISNGERFNPEMVKAAAAAIKSIKNDEKLEAERIKAISQLPDEAGQAIQSGALSPEKALDVASKAQEHGIDLADVLQSAAELNASQGKEAIPTDDAVDITINQAVTEAQSAQPPEEVSDETLMFQAWEMACSILLMVTGDDLDGAFESAKEKLQTYIANGGYMLSTSDRPYKDEVVKLLRSTVEKQAKLDSKFKKRLDSAAKKEAELKALQEKASEATVEAGLVGEPQF